MNINQAAIEVFNGIKRLPLSNLFTPIEKADRLREALPGAPHIYIKRDDCTGYLGGGNKLRKLEYVMAEVLAQGATTVITIGSTSSNHARTTALVARRLGLQCVLVLNDDVPQERRANFRIHDLLGVTSHIVATREERLPRMNEIAADLERRGERVYRIPLGCSDAIGSFGIVAALQEMAAQQESLQVDFDAIVVSSTSGGTQAGFEVGKRLFGLPDLQILGVSPAGPGERIKDYVLSAMCPMVSRLGLPCETGRQHLSVDDHFVGDGYGLPSQESADAARIFSQTEGILLDPVYTSKAAAALISYCHQQKFNETDHVLFWHTGGLMALF